MYIFKKILISSFLFLFTTPAFSATVSFVSDKQSFAQNEEFLVSIYLDTEGEILNAFEGKILFPVDFLTEKEIRDGNSFVNFWIEKPTSVPDGKGGKSGVIAFSGITPGGFSGTKGLLFSIVFQATQSGNIVIKMENLRFLKNDGVGTETKVSSSPLLFVIKKEILIPSLIVEPIQDNEPPEDFTPIISSDPNIFDGKYFLVFATQDKGSGIDQYLVSEDNGISFSPAHSPYLLENQSLDNKIIVKAVDKTGNQKTAEIQPKNSLIVRLSGLVYEKNFLIPGILLVSVLVIFVCRKKICHKNIAK
jgi:hypothetical protein